MIPTRRHSPIHLHSALAALLAVLFAAGCATTGNELRLPQPGDRPRVAAAAAAPGLDGGELYEETDEEAGGEQFAEFADAQPLPYVLLGTLLLPDRAVERGGLLIEDGIIQEVWEGDQVPAAAAGRVTVDTGGIILPGLIDLHNHVAYNFLPFWHAGVFFPNRYAWQRDGAYGRAVSQPYNAAKNAGLFDEMVKFGEVRALVGGTTSILGAAQTRGAGILVRNIDQRTLGRDAMRTNVGAVVEFGCSRGRPRCPEQAAEVERLRASFADGGVSAMVFHVAEGADADSRAEFDWLEEVGLVEPQVAVTHGTAFTAAEFAKMAAAGTPLIWSPRSNLELYAQTADVAAARAAGVRIALAPDWSPSGSDNLLAELRYAERFNQERLGGLLSAEELVAMATSVPAAIAGRGEELGRLEVGFFADILVLERVDPDPFRSVVASDERHVRLVAVGGVPLYGFPSWLERLGKAGDFERITLRGRVRALDTTVPAEFEYPKGTQTFAEIRQLLADAYAPFGTLPELTANAP